MKNYDVNFSELKGKVLASAVALDDDELIFTTTEGVVYGLHHITDCCESVTIDDICGDLDDICGAPLLSVEEVSRHGSDECSTWTFYKIDTIKGGVTIRWYGESSGDYSETVDFYQKEIVE